MWKNNGLLADCQCSKLQCPQWPVLASGKTPAVLQFPARAATCFHRRWLAPAHSQQHSGGTWRSRHSGHQGSALTQGAVVIRFQGGPFLTTHSGTPLPSCVSWKTMGWQSAAPALTNHVGQENTTCDTSRGFFLVGLSTVGWPVPRCLAVVWGGFARLSSVTHAVRQGYLA